MPDPGSGLYDQINAIVRRIPRGRVSTYGQIAALAGIPGHARQVGYALHALRPATRVPWHRVINAQGRISGRSMPGPEITQRMRLEQEGVVFGEGGKVSLTRYRWDPEQRKSTNKRTRRRPARRRSR